MPRLGLGPQLRRGTVRRRDRNNGLANNGRESATSMDAQRQKASLDTPPIMDVNLGLGPQIGSLVAEESAVPPIPVDSIGVDLSRTHSGAQLRGAAEAAAIERSWLVGYIAEAWGRQYLLVACIIALVAFLLVGPSNAPRCTPPGKAKFLGGMRWQGRAPSP